MNRSIKQSELKKASGLVRIPAPLDLRLGILAGKTGRSKSFYAKKALERYLEDMEDFLLAEAAKHSRKESYSTHELRKKLKLDD